MSDLVKELVRAFNINNHDCEIDTNLTVDDDGHITMVFSPTMSKSQCIDYLKNVRNKIIRTFYKDENSAEMSFFNLKCFPFSFPLSALKLNEQSFSYNLKIPVTSEVLDNLKSHLAHSMTSPMKEEMGDIRTKKFDKKKYIMCSCFVNNKFAREFAKKFCAEIEKLGFSAPELVVIHGPEVSINKKIFSNVQFVEKFVEKELWLTGRNFKFSSAEDDEIKALKDSLIQFIFLSTGIKIDCYDRSTYIGGDEDIILIPIVKDNGQSGSRYLTREEAKAINQAFCYKVLNGVTRCISDKFPVASSEKTKGIYGIDFYNKDISNCVINTLFENSVINKVGKDYRLEIKPNLKLLELYKEIAEMGLLQEPRLRFLRDREGGKLSHSETEKKTATLPRRGSGKKKKQPAAGMQTEPQTIATSLFERFTSTEPQPSTSSASTTSWSTTTEPVQRIDEEMQFWSIDISATKPSLSLRSLYPPRTTSDIKQKKSSSTRIILPKIPDKMTSTYIKPGVKAQYVSEISDEAQETVDKQPQHRNILKARKKGKLLRSADTSTDPNVPGTIGGAQSLAAQQSQKSTSSEVKKDEEGNLHSCKEKDPLTQSRRSFDKDPDASSFGNQSSGTPRSQTSDVKAEKSGGTGWTTQDQTKTSGNVKDKKTKVSLANCRDQHGNFAGFFMYCFYKVISPPSTPDPTKISTKGQRFSPNVDNDTSYTQSSKKIKINCHEKPRSNLDNILANQELPKQMEEEKQLVRCK